MVQIALPGPLHVGEESDGKGSWHLRPLPGRAGVEPRPRRGGSEPVGRLRDVLDERAARPEVAEAPKQQERASRTPEWYCKGASPVTRWAAAARDTQRLIASRQLAGAGSIGVAQDNQGYNSLEALVTDGLVKKPE